MKAVFQILTLIFSFFIVSCSNQGSVEKTSKLKIVTTTGILGDCIKNITGDHAEVLSLMGSGVDPHLYKPIHSDLQKLNDADIIIYNGLHLEGKMTDILEKLKKQKTVLALSDGLKENELITAGDFKTHDPHLWFNIKLWSNGLEYLTKAIQQKDTLNASIYNKNWGQYKEQLTLLDQKVTTEINSIPENQRLLITAHDAFSYFGKAYNIEVKGLQGISTIAQAGIKDVTELVDLIVTRNIKAIFVESSISVKQIEVVVENCKAKNHHLKIGGTLYSDAMGNENTIEGTYLGMVEHNISTIVKALK